MHIFWQRRLHTEENLLRLTNLRLSYKTEHSLIELHSSVQTCSTHSLYLFTTTQLLIFSLSQFAANSSPASFWQGGKQCHLYVLQHSTRQRIRQEQSTLQELYVCSTSESMNFTSSALLYADLLRWSHTHTYYTSFLFLHHIVNSKAEIKLTYMPIS